jgi:hypothetical protein
VSRQLQEQLRSRGLLHNTCFQIKVENGAPAKLRIVNKKTGAIEVENIFPQSPSHGPIQAFNRIDWT